MAILHSLFFFLVFSHLGCFSIFSSPNPNTVNEDEESSAPAIKKTKIGIIRSYLRRIRRLPPSPDPIPIADTDAKEQSKEVPSSTILAAFSTAGKRLLSELREGDSGSNVVRIIFHSGWKRGSLPTVHRIFKIHHSPKTLARFEEYRDLVRSRAARGAKISGRCVADGNERLRFYCSTMITGTAPGGGGGVCASPYCGACAIVRQGFVGKRADLEGIATHATSWGAHVTLPEGIEEDFAFLHVRRAMFVCRVVAGRVARAGDDVADEEEMKKGTVFDSVVPAVVGESEQEGEELLVFNPRAVLPCFIIMYSV